MSFYQQEQRDNHSPGYVYLIEAIGFGGIIPGKFLRRCKIGLSRDPDARLYRFKTSQFPCDVRIVVTIYTEDMAATEDDLHELFEHNHVKIEKSREWFDLPPWQYYRCLWAFKSRELLLFTISELPITKVMKGILAIALATTLGFAAYTQIPQMDNKDSIEKLN